jgi:RimJ/RimL family protein N-acetyltransferase|uniref:GNAT family N-acetyltransferase n=1 Tax=Prosthecobacter sp. TaxID=1965333 RepID=UPI00378420CA
MNPVFELVPFPPDELIDSLSCLHPEDSFFTSAYSRGQSLLGFHPCLLVLKDGEETVLGCLAFLKKGRFTKSLDIPSLPDLPFDSPFWDGLLDFCKSSNIWDLTLRRIVPSCSRIGMHALQTSRETGVEYRLSLKFDSEVAPTSSNHRRSVAKAKKLGLVAQRRTDASAVSAHLELMQSSMSRRAVRGEKVPLAINRRFYDSMLSTGAGEFFQASRGETIRSSIFLLRTSSGAYYQSAGTSPEGMDEGASPFLIVETAKVLSREGVTCFDLGGAHEHEVGLRRFKSGYGAVETPFEIVAYSTARPIFRKLRTGVRLLRSAPLAAIRSLVCMDCSAVYRANPACLPPPDSLAEAVMEKLSDEQVASCCGPDTEFSRQAERMCELGYNDAYGVFISGELAHVSWLISAEHDQVTPEREIMLREGEVEITHCFTGEKWRGKGIYPFAIRSLCQRAAARSIRLVFMVAHSGNIASRRGIEKAGLRNCGRLVRLRLPFLFGERALRIRTHRLGILPHSSIP